MYLTTGNSIQGLAGTASTITYTLNGSELGSTGVSQILVSGQLSATNNTLFTAIEKVTEIKTITLVNTSASSVSGIILSLNGGLPTNQIIGELVIPANGTAIYSNETWSVLSPQGLQVIAVTSSNVYYITKIDTSTPNLTYIGKAEISTLDSEPAWQIRLIDETTPITTILYADGTDGFINVWDDRLTYTYS